MKRLFCDVRVADTFALQFKPGAVDVIDAPDTGLEAPEDAAVRGDPRAACSSSKLRIESSHRDVTDCILVNIYSDGSSGIIRDGHCVSDDGSAPVNRAHAPDQYTRHKKRKR